MATKPRSGRTLKAVPEPDQRPAPPDLRDAVASSLEAMTWLSESDKALAALAMKYAAEIEKAADRAEELATMAREVGAAGDLGLFKRMAKLEAAADSTKAVGWLGPQLQGVLRDLGGTPAARKAIGAEGPVKGRLAELRDARGKATTPGK